MNREEETITCFCEDVTEEEIVQAIEEGYTTPKEIKQHLRVGMGECQGGLHGTICLHNSHDNCTDSSIGSPPSGSRLCQ